MNMHPNRLRTPTSLVSSNVGVIPRLFFSEGAFRSRHRQTQDIRDDRATDNSSRKREKCIVLE